MAVFPDISLRGDSALPRHLRLHLNYALDKYDPPLHVDSRRVNAMSILSAPHFHDKAAAIARLEAIVWPNGPYCPRCGGFDRITTVKGGRAGLRRCGPCKREFTVTVRTIFERSHVPLNKWFQAAHLMASSKKGMSAHQLHRTLQVQYKTAWFIEHRLREAMCELHPMAALGGEGKTVEIDESYVGGKDRNRHANKRKRLYGTLGKEPVFSLVEQGQGALFPSSRHEGRYVAQDHEGTPRRKDGRLHRQQLHDPIRGEGV